MSHLAGCAAASSSNSPSDYKQFYHLLQRRHFLQHSRQLIVTNTLYRRVGAMQSAEIKMTETQTVMQYAGITLVPLS